MLHPDLYDVLFVVSSISVESLSPSDLWPGQRSGLESFFLRTEGLRISNIHMCSMCFCSPTCRCSKVLRNELVPGLAVCWEEPLSCSGRSCPFCARRAIHGSTGASQHQAQQDRRQGSEWESGARGCILIWHTEIHPCAHQLTLLRRSVSQCRFRACVARSDLVCN